MKLRDFYSNLETLCAEEQIDQTELIESLKKIDYHYSSDKNQFV